MDIDLLNSVTGGADLLEWFGGQAPRFHDAEVLSIAFDREGPTCILRVHGFEMTSQVNSEGFFILKNHAVVTFEIREVVAMQIDNFNFQNALMGLSIVRVPNSRIRVELDPANGLSGSIEGCSLAISLSPGVPSGSQYDVAANVR